MKEVLIFDKKNLQEWFVLSRFPVGITWEEANEIAKKKGQGWRLPEINELSLLYNEKSGEIHKEFLTNFEPRHFQRVWSAQEYNSCSALVFNFDINLPEARRIKRHKTALTKARKGEYASFSPLLLVRDYTSMTKQKKRFIAKTIRER